MPEPLGTRTGLAGIANFHFSRHDLEHVARKFAARAPKVYLESQCVAARLRVDDPLERCIRYKPAVPVVFAFDLNAREARRQCCAGHYVLGPNDVSGGVKTNEIAGPYVDRADAEASCAGIDTVEIHETLQRAPEIADVVKA